MTTNEHEQEREDQQAEDEAPAAGMSNEEALEVEEEMTDGSGFPG